MDEKLSRDEQKWGPEELLRYFSRRNSLWALGSTRDAAWVQNFQEYVPALYPLSSLCPL